MIALPSAEARTLLEDAGVSFAGWALVSSRDEAQQFAECHDGPLALKSAARDVIHKSDVGCVVLNVTGADEVAQAYDTVSSNAAKAGSTESTQVIVETMVSGLAEVMIGIKRDETFGPVVMAGLGGIWVEIMQDVTMCLCPVNETEAGDMLKRLKGFAVLNGERTGNPIDLQALEHLIVTVSKLAIDRSDILALDLNPVIADAEGVKAVDARIFVENDT